jgi:TPR repeat protein
MCNLGNLYYYGRGVKCNYLTALDWYKQAAVLNDAKAQCYLGDMYILGDKPGIKRDVVAGFYWYEQSAKNGYPIGQYNLAIIYEIGNEYIKQDYDLAIKWYKEAISSGYMKAKNALGVCILALTLQTEENFSLAKYN